MKLKSSLAFLTVLVSLVGYGAEYTIDMDHSSVNFSVKHLVISKVKGKFEKFEGTINYDAAKPLESKVTATIAASTINTNTKERDKHLKSADFLDVAKFPKITFTSTKIYDFSGNKGKIDGNLTIKGVTKPVTLDMEIGGLAKDPWGNSKAAFTGKTVFKRSDFGITWNKALETGGVVVGDEIDVELEIEANEKAPQKPAISDKNKKS